MSNIVLIIEDNLKHRFILEDLLDEAGYELEFATNDDEVREKMASGVAFDLILVDIAVPGFKAIEFIRDHKNKYQIMVVSNYADDENVREVLPDTKRRIKKPFDTNDLLKRVEEILNPGR